MLDTLSRDVRYAIRSFTRSPGFTATAVLTIALGIGATTAIFSIVYGVLLRPLPFPEPGRLVMLQPRTDGIDTDAMSPASFLEWQRRTVAFDRIAAFTGRPATFGVLMYSVARRTREIGVRMAVGAAPAVVVLLIVREMLTMTIAGMAVGVTGALAAAALIRNLLFAIDPTDPTTFAFASGLVLLICSAASFVPARRAARIDPAVTLKAS